VAQPETTAAGLSADGGAAVAGTARTSAQALAQALVRKGSPRAPAWCIFDNTAHGHAMDDAARLQERLVTRR
jgi:hypothetical protein